MENPIITYPLKIEVEILRAFSDCGMTPEYIVSLERMLRREAAKAERLEEEIALLRAQRAGCEMEDLERLGWL